MDRQLSQIAAKPASRRDPGVVDVRDETTAGRERAGASTRRARLRVPGGRSVAGACGVPPGSLVVVDPADGPGDAIDPTYVAAISGVRRPGIGMFGYVTTDYGNRSVDWTIRKVASYERWYQPTGIFFDQTPPASRSRKAITATFEYVRSRRMSLAINPGQPDIDPEDAHACDYVVNFEETLADYRRASFPAWTVEIGPERFWHLVYDVPGRTSLRGRFGHCPQSCGSCLRHRLADAQSLGGLPTYWKDELRLLKRPLQRGGRRRVS